MARVRSVSADRPVPLAKDEWPSLDPTIQDLPTNTWRRMGILRRHSSLALLRLPAGTDRPDYVLEDSNGSVLSPSVPASGVLRLYGHLWVDIAAKPLTLQLPRDLTIVVAGNLYLGRSIHVRGPGRLVLVVTRGTGDMFRDLDLDGAWSEGDELLTAHDRPFRGSIEGSGAVYFGLPAGNPVPGRIRIDAAVIADGEVHIQCPVTEVWGALAVGHGVTGAQRHRLLTPGLLLPDTQRERMPGFKPLGGPRPGILRLL